MKKLLLFTILISSITFAKEYKIISVIDNDIFELENGQRVQLAEVYVPSIKDSNAAVNVLAMQIYKWVTGLLVGHNYVINFMTKDALPQIRIYRSYLGGDEDIALRYILYGYAIFTGDNNSEKYNDYMEDQNIAQKNKRGIWSLEPDIQSVLVHRKTIPSPIKPTYDKEMSTVKLLNGETLHGKFLSATDSTATYQTTYGVATVKKNLVISVQKDAEGSGNNIEAPKNKIMIKEYRSLPLLVLTIAGGVWAYTLFKDASDYSDAANILSNFGSTFKAQVDEANSRSSTKLWTGIGVTAVSIVFFVLAITPTKTYIEQPVTFIPTSNGIQVVIRF